MKTFMKILNITVPDELSRDLESIPNKNSFITEALKEKLEKERRKKLDYLLIEGYKETKNEDKCRRFIGKENCPHNDCSVFNNLWLFIS